MFEVFPDLECAGQAIVQAVGDVILSCVCSFVCVVLCLPALGAETGKRKKRKIYLEFYNFFFVICLFVFQIHVLL